MHDNIIAGVKNSQIGMCMKPTYDIHLGEPASAIVMDSRPGISRKSEMDRAMIFRYSGECSLNLDIGSALILIGAAQ